LQLTLRATSLTLLLLLPSPALSFDLASPISNEVEFDQFHVQTDGNEESPGSFFRYQTRGGQLRREWNDGEGGVRGAFGWIDAGGVLRVTDYAANDNGYRVLGRRVIRLDSDGGVQRARAEMETVRRRKFDPDERDAEDAAVDAAGPASSSSGRLVRRIFEHGNGVKTIKVQPLFGATAARSPAVSIADQPYFVGRIQPRGEGSRTRYVPRDSRDGRAVRVVKRRRRPAAVSDAAPAGAVSSVDYSTGKAYHREATDPVSGERVGEYGYIDPLGVRRVVTYAVDAKGNFRKEKENDYVGDGTYFAAV